MKILYLIILLPLLFFSCINTENDCSGTLDLTVPMGFEVEKVSTMPYGGKMQFIDGHTGYILGRTPGEDFVEVYKTENGGTSWRALNVGVPYIPVTMIFVDLNLGIIPLYKGDKAVIIKTTDGGITWTEKKFNYLNGRLNNLRTDSEGNLYAELVHIGDDDRILKSTDQGESWHTIAIFPDLTVMRIKIQEDKIYLLTTDNEIIVTDLEGNQLKTIEVSYLRGTTHDMHVIDENNLIISKNIALIRTNDGGTTWEEMTLNESRVLVYNSSDDAVIISDIGSCGDNPNEFSKIVHTTDGGQSWTESENIEWLIDRYIDSDRLDENRWMILVDEWNHMDYSLFLLSKE